MVLFTKIFNGLSILSIFCKKLHLRCLIGPKYATDNVLLTSDHASTFDLPWLKKHLFNRLKDKIVVTTINGTPDAVTFLEGKP